MPRLPVNGGEQPPTPVIRLTWPGIVLGLALVVLQAFGYVWLADWLGLDLGCLDARGRGGHLVQTVVCSVSSGPRGWLYLAVFALPLVVVALWLRHRLRASRQAEAGE